MSSSAPPLVHPKMVMGRGRVSLVKVQQQDLYLAT